MRAIAWLLRVFCYLFHTILSLALLAFGVLAVLSGSEHMRMETLPWQGTELNRWLIVLGIVGLLSVVLAVTGKLRLLLPLWAIYVMWMLVKGVMLNPNTTFAGRSDFNTWLWLMGGALLAMLGSFTVLSRRKA